MRTEFSSSLSTLFARSPSNHAKSGAWPLAAGHATTLEATQDSLLRVRAGRIWLTRDASRGGASEDIVLEAGSSYTVAAGEAVVIESWGAMAGEAAWFAWDALPAAARARRPAVSYQAAVGAPLAELAQALRMASRAFGALLAGVPRFAMNSIAGRSHSAGAAG